MLLTPDGHERSRDDDLLVKLVLESLTEHVHVQTPIEPEAEPLPEKARRLARDGDGPVGQRQATDRVFEFGKAARVEGVDAGKDHRFQGFKGLKWWHRRAREMERVAQESCWGYGRWASFSSPWMPPHTRRMMMMKGAQGLLRTFFRILHATDEPADHAFAQDARVGIRMGRDAQFAGGQDADIEHCVGLAGRCRRERVA